MDNFTLQILKDHMDRLDERVDGALTRLDGLESRGETRDLKVELMTGAFNRLTAAVSSGVVIIVTAAVAALLFGGR